MKTPTQDMGKLRDDLERAIRVAANEGVFTDTKENALILDLSALLDRVEKAESELGVIDVFVRAATKAESERDALRQANTKLGRDLQALGQSHDALRQERDEWKRQAHESAEVTSAAVAERDEWHRKWQVEFDIVDRVWRALGVTDYESAGGKSIYELVFVLTARLKEAESLLRETIYEDDERTVVNPPGWLGRRKAFLQGKADANV